jgi:FkbM family methyltransferase
LSILLLGLLVANRDQIIRRVRFWQTGTVRVYAYTFRLDPQDRMMTQYILRFGEWERAQTATIRSLLRPGDTFIDIGASFGWYTVIASDAVGKEGRVIAFEPAPAAFELLRLNVKANGCENVTLEPKALSDRRGTVQLHLHESNKGSHSILPSKERQRTVTVEAVSLDEYLEGCPGEVAVVKIDTEGAEGIILDGMSETLNKHPRMSVILEFTPDSLRQVGHDPGALLHRFYSSDCELFIIDEYSGLTIPLNEGKALWLVDVLESRQEFVNLLIKRATRPGA